MTTARATPCPICRRVVSLPDFRPFCSLRCKDIDLGRWFTGSYAIPVAPSPEDDELDPDEDR